MSQEVPPPPPPPAVSLPPAGWYPVSGSRYEHWWDGRAWQRAVRPAPPPQISATPRLLAFAIDTAISAGPFAIYMTLVSSPADGAVVLLMLWALVASWWNLVECQGRTGSSIGKERVGLRIVSIATGGPAGRLASAKRMVGSFGTFFCFWFIPLLIDLHRMGEGKRRLADVWAATQVEAAASGG